MAVAVALFAAGIAMGLAGACMWAWAVHSGQFRDLETTKGQLFWPDLAPPPDDEPPPYGELAARPAGGVGLAPRPSEGGGPRQAMRVPPHNLAAEESLLGAMLLSKDAIASAVEIVDADAFYKPAHGHIFEAVATLFSAGEPVDPVSVAEELSRLNTHLDEVARILKTGGAAGKRLDFLMQELNREANTLGSKSAATDVVET